MSSPQPRGATIKVSVVCQRCGQTHVGLEFKPLSNPSDSLNWWTMCPVNREPIVCQVVPGEVSEGMTSAASTRPTR